MNNDICVLVCHNHLREIEAVLDSDDFDGVRYATYPSQKGMPPLAWADVGKIIGEVSECRHFCLFAGCCAPPTQDVPVELQEISVARVDYCAKVLADPAFLDLLTENGSYVITPGWLDEWQKNAEEMGITRDSAKAFSGSMKELVLLDTGVHPNAAATMRDCADFFGMPYKIIPVGLDHFRTQVKTLVLEKQRQLMEKQHAQTAAQARRELAEYILTLDITTELAGSLSEEEIIQKTLQLFTSVFSPDVAHYLRVADGVIGELSSFPEAASPNSTARAQFVERLTATAANHHWDDNTRSYVFRVVHHDTTLGYFELSHIAFPEFRQHYLGMAQYIVGVCALALNNARSFQKLQETEGQLRDAMVRVEDSARAKSAFLANMSHEIRTPMNGVIGVLDLLRATPLSESQQELVNTIDSCGSSLVTIVDDILDYSKIEARQLTLEKAPFNLPSLISEIALLFDAQAKKQKDTIEHNLLGSSIHEFIGDQVRVRQILSNLVSNAIKFTTNGKITIHADIQALSPRDCKLHFTVKDTGIGIAKALQKKIFKSFTQADVSTTRKYGGTGLGLTISHSLCTMMDGEMWVESEEDQGSEFHFTLFLPRAVESTTSPDATERAPLAAKSDFSLSILIAEDNPTNQLVLSKLLEMLGHHCEIAKNGKEAVAALENQQSYDVVFMDMQMPVMDGLEATRRIVKRWGTKRPDIIAMTANVMAEDREKCLSAGMIDFVSKPVSGDNLMDVLAKYAPA